MFAVPTWLPSESDLASNALTLPDLAGVFEKILSEGETLKTAGVWGNARVEKVQSIEVSFRDVSPTHRGVLTSVCQG